LEKLFVHYGELQRWNPVMSLIGPGTEVEVIERHYGESLLALTLFESHWRVVVDVGSGGGFPGIVLACARPDLEVTLVESRGRKCSFLKTVCRKASLSCRCLNARVAEAPVAGLPESIDLFTSRAVKLSRHHLEAAWRGLSPTSGVLLWVGAKEPEFPEGWTKTQELKLPGTRHRRILKIRRRVDGARA
jgi:16S rRNA (guanine527-N7)-methyltransferase